MVVKEGYKQSEVGVIPEDWECVELGEYAYITKLAGFEYSKYFNSYNEGGEIIVIRGTNITNNKLDLTDVKSIPRQTSNFLKRSQLNKNDLVFAYVGTIGPVYLITENEKYHLGPNTAKIKVNSEILPQYAFNYFTSDFILREIEYHTSIGAQPSLSMTKIRKFKIILPLLPEQKAIATALSNIDSLINSLTKLIEKKKNIKQGAMQELLTGKKRLDGFSGEWVEVRLSDVLEIGHGQSQQRIENINGKYPILGSSGEIGRTDTFLYDKPSVLIGRKGTINDPQYMDSPFWTIDTLFYTKLQHSISAKFIYYLFCTINWLNYNEASGVPSLSSKTIKSIRVSIPLYIEQTAIASILSDMDTEIETLQVKLNKYKAIKQGMMQELLTGRIRLLEGA